MAPAFQEDWVIYAQEEQAKIYVEDKYYWGLALEKIREGWLKPHKQLRPFNNNSKINYNLPRSRLREKKQIFLLKAA